MRPEINGSNILVTGGAGFIGSHLVDKLIEAGAREIIIVDNLFLGRRENISCAISKGAKLCIEDAEIYSSMEYIFSKYNIDIVFNCATKALIYSFMNPSNAYMTNVLVMNNLLELQRKKAFKTLCHFSSSEVYGSAVYEPMDENHPLHPTTAYAAGKASADIMLKSYVKMYDLDAFIVRPFNNYGPRQNYEGDLMGVIPKTVIRILNSQAPVIYGSGKQSRNFIYVLDTVETVLQVYKKLAPGEEVNIANDNSIAIQMLIEMICRHMKYKGEILYEDARKADVENHNADIRKLKSLISFTPTRLEDGLESTIDWYRRIYNCSRNKNVIKQLEGDL